MDQEQPARPFALAAWRVEPARLAISGPRDDEVRITPRSMAVLVTLAEADGGVVRKHELLDRVWPRQEVSEGVLSQAIAELRGAFGDCARAPQMIETIRSVGFRLMPEVRWDGPAVAGDEAPARPSRTLVTGAVLLAAAALIVGISLGPPFVGERSQNRSAVPVLMIVPFEQLGPGDQERFFARGMADEISVRVGSMPSIRLIAQRALGVYLDRGLSPRDVAEEVGADLILTGSVRRASKVLRLVVQLSDAETARQLWAASYDRPMDDVFAVQSEVAQAIADVLSSPLRRPRSAPTRDLTAYDYYLKGSDYLSRLEPAAVDQAIELLQQALHLDPAFSLARARLAEALAVKGYLFHRGPAYLAQALEEAALALDQDPDHPQAYYARALSLFGKGALRTSEVAIRRAVELAPNHVDIAFLAGAVADARGKIDTAIDHYLTALQLDPTLPRTVALGRLLYLVGAEERALRYVERGPELWRGPPLAYASHVLTLMGQGTAARTLCDAALAAAVPQAANLCGCDAFLNGELARAEALLADDWQAAPVAQWGPFTFMPSATPLASIHASREEHASATSLLAASEAVTRAQLSTGNGHWALRYNMAAVSALRGEPETANEWLEKAYETGFRDSRLLALDPTFAEILDTPRGAAVRARIQRDLRAAGARLTARR